ncbi:hypothetical protein FACS1894172_08450 [Spirochaetia bacterium]|nr:hypothetical protein FACS1894164_13890 [Spirochaetia bacterium]GHU32223.1 hypothetical protein FACS1894172_08450 [Spirochaetia bacterium]
MTKIIASLVVIMLLFGACDMGDTDGQAGNLRIAIGGGRATLSDDVTSALRYDITLTGPNGEVEKRTLAGENALSVTVIPGEWGIAVEAFTDQDILAGTGSTSVKVEAGKKNSAVVQMHVNGGYFGITLDATLTGKATANFPAAFPGTTVTLSLSPDAGEFGEPSVNAGTVLRSPDARGMDLCYAGC